MASKRWILAQLWHRKVACFCSRRPPLYRHFHTHPLQCSNSRRLPKRP